MHSWLQSWLQSWLRTCGLAYISFQLKTMGTFVIGSSAKRISHAARRFVSGFSDDFLFPASAGTTWTRVCVFSIESVYVCCFATLRHFIRFSSVRLIFF